MTAAQAASARRLINLMIEARDAISSPVVLNADSLKARMMTAILEAEEVFGVMPSGGVNAPAEDFPS